MKKINFALDVCPRGYVIRYMGTPIGGGGLPYTAKNPRGIASKRLALKFFSMGEAEIEALTQGFGKTYLLEQIREVNLAKNP